MATYVEFSAEEDQGLDLARYLNKLRTKGKEPDETFFAECSQLSKNKQIDQLLSKLLQGHQVLFMEGSEKDIEAFFSVILFLMKKLPPESLEKIVTLIKSALITNTEEKSLLRLKLLSHLYNSLENPLHRFEVFTTILNFCSASRKIDVLLATLKDFESRIKEWGISEEQTKQTFKLIRDILKKENKSSDSFKWTIKYLSTFNSSNTSSDEAINEAVQGVIDAIGLPTLYQYDNLLDLLPIKQLETKNPKLFQLLKIFVSETLDSFRAFTEQNRDFLKSLGISEEECLRKMRLLSLASLGATNNEISYSLIAKTLQISESEVELWTITAIGENIIDAKLDQLRGVIIVSRCLQRVFTRAQWRQLSDHLSVWKTGIKALLQTLQDRQQYLPQLKAQTEQESQH